MHRGYIKLYRKILDTSMLSDPPMLQVWCWLLLHATHKPREVSYKGELFHLKTGDIFASIRTIARNTKNTLGVVKRRLDVLETAQRIERRKTHRGTIISICKWKFYQDNNNGDKSQNGTQDRTVTEHRRNADGTQTEQEQACKHNKNVKETALPYGEKFKAAWSDWVQFRKEIKKKLTSIAIIRQLKKLSEYKSEEIAVAVIYQSIEKTWTGLFDLKEENNKKKQSEDYDPFENCTYDD